MQGVPSIEDFAFEKALFIGNWVLKFTNVIFDSIDLRDSSLADLLQEASLAANFCWRDNFIVIS